MVDLVYLDLCNKKFVDKYTKLAFVLSKQITKRAKATIYSFVETNIAYFVCILDTGHNTGSL